MATHSAITPMIWNARIFTLALLGTQHSFLVNPHNTNSSAQRGRVYFGRHSSYTLGAAAAPGAAAAAAAVLLRLR